MISILDLSNPLISIFAVTVCDHVGKILPRPSLQFWLLGHVLESINDSLYYRRLSLTELAYLIINGGLRFLKHKNPANQNDSKHLEGVSFAIKLLKHLRVAEQIRSLDDVSQHLLRNI